MKTRHTLTSITRPSNHNLIARSTLPPLTLDRSSACRGTPRTNNGPITGILVLPMLNRAGTTWNKKPKVGRSISPYKPEPRVFSGSSNPTSSGDQATNERLPNFINRPKAIWCKSSFLTPVNTIQKHRIPVAQFVSNNRSVGSDHHNDTRKKKYEMSGM